MEAGGCLTLPMFRWTAWIDAWRTQLAAVLSSFRPAKKAAADDSAVWNQRAAEFLDIYGNQILRYAYSYLHNLSDAEEVLQDTLLQFLKTRPILETPQHEKAWLLRVAGNLSKNRLQFHKSHPTDELQEELTAEGREDLSFVWEAVQTLPVNYREVIHLFYYEGYSTREIADLLQKNESTVRSDLRRGRMKLKEVLKEAYDFEEPVS